VINLLMRGGLAGIIATVVMSLVIFGGRAIGLLHTPPPRQITGKVVRTARMDQDLPAEVSGPVFEATWLASHLGYGAACGALYALVRLLLPAPAVAAGLAYGLVVWGLSYLHFMPTLGLYPRPQEDRPSRMTVMIAAHAVYGVTLAEVEWRLKGRMPTAGRLTR
jgi:uncharacterized membrane protein YagU involved in acid resistance